MEATQDQTRITVPVQTQELTSRMEQIRVSGRIKTMNESIYYNVDAIHTSIAENKKIKFQYFQWNVKKEMELRHDGKYYQPFLNTGNKKRVIKVWC